MNVIGVFAPKIVSFFVILFSPITSENKAVFIAIWLLKLIIDYDVAKPSHNGNLYKPVKKLEVNTQVLIVGCIRFVPVAAFLIAALQMRAWLICVVGAISAIVHIVSICFCIKDVIAEYRRRREECK